MMAFTVSRLLSVPGVRLVSPREGPVLSGLVCFRLGDLEPDAVTASLRERAGVVAGGRQDRSGYPVEYEEATRLSTAWFNTEYDVDRVVAELEQRVLAALDPPLNLEGMPRSELRIRLTALRRRVTGSALWKRDAAI